MFFDFAILQLNFFAGKICILEKIFFLQFNNFKNFFFDSWKLYRTLKVLEKSTADRVPIQ